MKEQTSEFMTAQLKRLHRAYDFSFTRECDCMEYRICRHKTQEEISKALVLTVNRFSKMIHVSRFYPELHKETDAKYLSAACFYLLIHHMGQAYGLGRDFGICLQCRTEIFHGFYEKLKEFDLRICRALLSSSADVVGTYVPSAVDTTPILEIPPWSDPFTYPS